MFTADLLMSSSCVDTLNISVRQHLKHWQSALPFITTNVLPLKFHSQTSERVTCTSLGSLRVVFYSDVLFLFLSVLAVISFDSIRKTKLSLVGNSHLIVNTDVDIVDNLGR